MEFWQKKDWSLLGWSKHCGFLHKIKLFFPLTLTLTITEEKRTGTTERGINLELSLCSHKLSGNSFYLLDYS